MNGGKVGEQKPPSNEEIKRQLRATPAAKRQKHHQSLPSRLWRGVCDATDEVLDNLSDEDWLAILRWMGKINPFDE
jgi:hypothetical protein